MSRLFEALQRSEAERSGSPLPEIPSAATDLLQAAEAGEAHSASVRATRAAAEERPAATLPEAPGATLEGLRSLQSFPISEGRLVSITQQDGLGAEKFRLLGVRLRNMRANRTLKRILVTSTIPEEGKSVVSANLALVLARGGRTRTVLVEGDLRRPTLANRFGLGKLPGLVDALTGEKALNEVIYQLEPSGLCCIPAGHPPENPLELMQSGRAAAALTALSQFFEWIVVDSPPVLPLADTILWSKRVDGVVLVAREGKTEKRQLLKGLELLDRSRLLGVVLNASTSTDHKNYYQRYTPASTNQM
jgi:capsular exopolysaccharide synthesis family protein